MQRKSWVALLLSMALVVLAPALASCSTLSAYHSEKTLARRIAKLAPPGTHRDDVVQRLLDRGIPADRISTYERDEPEPSTLHERSDDMQTLFQVPAGAEVWSYTVARAKSVPVLWFSFPIPFPIARSATFIFEFDAQQNLLNSGVRIDLMGP